MQATPKRPLPVAVSLLAACLVPSTLPPTTARAAAPGRPTAATAATDTAAPVTMASQAQAQRLFAKGTVTGEDLKEELAAVKAGAANARTETALASLVGQASSQMAVTQSHNFFTDLGARLKEFVGDLLRQKAISYSDRALEDFLATLTGDTAALRNETIVLPTAAAANMTLTEQQSVLLMASLVVGSRIAHHILDAAHKDFIGLEAEYAALLAKRQEQAALMADVLDKRRQALAAKDELTVRHMEADLAKWLSPEDLKFIDSFGPGTSLREFANDLGMQNLAVKFLQHRDPKAYAQYRAEQTGLTGRSRAYVRVTSGIAAFGAFSLAFIQEIARTAKDKNTYQVFATLPFATDFIKEAVPLIKLSSDSLFMGLVVEPGSLKHHYRLVRHDAVADVNDAGAVFKALERSQEAPYFADALFRSSTPGFIYHVYLCDHEEAGALIDETVKQGNRKAFAEQQLQLADGAGFSFAAALNDDLRTPAGQSLAESLLSRDERSTADVVAIGEVQRQTASAYAKWKTTELTRLILANSQGGYAQMQIGDTIIRLIPSMATLYAYETYADSCGRAASGTETPKPGKHPPKPKKTAHPPTTGIPS